MGKTEKTRPRPDLIGLSEDEIRERFGQPRLEKRCWVYVLPFGPGAHQLRDELVLSFQEGKVVKAIQREVPTGCVYVPMDEG